MLINIIIISEVLEHMFLGIKMANISPFRCPKILFGPFRWLKSFSVFSRTAKMNVVNFLFITYGHSGIIDLRQEFYTFSLSEENKRFCVSLVISANHIAKI